MTPTFNGKIGVEVECTVHRSKFNLVRDLTRTLGHNQAGWVISGDGSVSGSGDNIAYEIRTSRESCYPVANLQPLFDDFAKLAPHIKVNRTCGLHIHLSFENKSDYFRLCSLQFIKSFQDNIKSLFKTKLEKARLTNHYCALYKLDAPQTVTNAITNQVESMLKSGSRYQSINFNSVNLYGTVEFRIFAPTNKPAKFKKYVNFLIEQVNSITTKQLNEIKHSVSIDDTTPFQPRQINIRETL